MALMNLIPWRRSTALSSTPELSSVTSLQREMNRMFDEFWGNGGRGMSHVFPQQGNGSFFPDLDISETDKFVDLTAEVPGMTDKEIKLNLAEDGETLTLEGEKKTQSETRSEGMYCTERTYGHFRRVIPLPSRVDANAVEATCKNGVLTVHMKKLPDKEQHIKQIPIKTA